MTTDPQWPDCHEVQCAQVHETLNSLLDLLGCECDKSVYVVGKMIHICEALKAKDAEIEKLKRQVEALKYPRSALLKTFPVVLYLPTNEDREALIAAVQEANPNLRAEQL